MTPADLTLARRAVACAGLSQPFGDPHRSYGHGSVRDLRGVLWKFDQGGRMWSRTEPGEHRPAWLPDLTDPATLGCLLALVREVRRAPLGHLVHVSGEHLWGWRDSSEHFADVYGSTEAAALVAALEAACQE